MKQKYFMICYCVIYILTKYLLSFVYICMICRANKIKDLQQIGISNQQIEEEASLKPQTAIDQITPCKKLHYSL